MAVSFAVVPAAGLGTRMLPVSGAIPKEMLPIGRFPVFHYTLCEIARAGIGTVVLVTAGAKTALENYLNPDERVWSAVRGSDKESLLDEVQALRERIDIVTVRQREQRGLGHAVATAAPVVGDASFAVLLPDELILEEPDGALAALVRHADDRTGAVSLCEVAAADVHRYGIAAVGGALPAPIRDVVEKPSAAAAPSRWAIVGRYVFPAKFRRALRDLRPGAGGELQLTDAMRAHLDEFPLRGVAVTGARHDTGNPTAYADTWRAYLRDPAPFERQARPQ